MVKARLSVKYEGQSCRSGRGGTVRDQQELELSQFQRRKPFWTRAIDQSCMWECMHAKSPQSCLTLCIPMDCSLPGSSVHGILQARILEWVAIPFS